MSMKQSHEIREFGDKEPWRYGLGRRGTETQSFHGKADQ